MIVGQMALADFPLQEQCLLALCSLVDKVYLRYDGKKHFPECMFKHMKLCGDKWGASILVHTAWNNWNWREEMLRMLDSVKPDYVLTLDEDEELNGNLADDIALLERSGKTQLMFPYAFPMPTEDGWVYPKNKPYPSKPHAKLVRWRPGLTYKGYNGRARLGNVPKTDYVIGKCEILHYRFYNERIRMRGKLTAKEKMRD